MGAYTQDHRLIQIMTPLGKDVLLLQGFSGQEGISRLFHFDLRMHSENRAITYTSIIGKKATLRIITAEGERYINGFISSFAQGGTSTIEVGTSKGIFASYHATLVPWLWMLTRTSDCRIFQNKSVPEILQTIFQENQFTDFKLRLRGEYPPREYCVQYRETDFNFVSRLMEEEGIFYFFEHEENKHTLVLADNPNEFKPCPTKPEARHEAELGAGRREEVITEWNIGQEVRPGKYELRDFFFEQPSLNLTATVNGKDERHYEIYDYPGEYTKKDRGESIVGNRMQEEETPQIVAHGSSSCLGFVSGFRFDLKEHYRKDLNKAYVLTSLYMATDMGTNYASSGIEAGENLDYVNHFQCIPYPTPFRPPRITPVPIVHGSQTAMVVGPKGEEIFTDKYGRVKVQFHWDREGEYDEKSSCWVRVSQPLAGKGWGMMYIPRIGQEVIVDFLEGDPDQPIITGRVYNADSMPPYTLPDEKTKSTFKSYSSKGGGGFNEIRFEDKKGDEQVFIHGEKDLDVRIKNDRREWIGRDRNLIVKRDKVDQIERDKQSAIKRNKVQKVGSDHHLTVGGMEAISIGGSRSLEVKRDVAEKFKMNHSEDVGMCYYLKAGMTLVIEAGVQLSLKVGGNFIDINPAGVFIQGTMVMINSGGAAGSGTPGTLVSPQEPKDAEIADNADPGSKEPTYKQQRAAMSPAQAAAADAPWHDPHSPENREKKSWIEIKLTNKEGRPVPGEPYKVTLSDGSTVAEGTLDEQGYARVNGIDPGQCKVTFPRLDRSVWKRK